MRCVLVACLVSAAWGATCPAGTTHVVDTLSAADGAAFTGRISVRGPVSPDAAETLMQTVVRPAIGVDGGVDFCLLGGVGYRYAVIVVVLDANGRQVDTWPEVWIVPARDTGTMTIRELRAGGSPIGLVSPQQINPAGLAAGQTWVWDGHSYVAGSCSGGTVAPTWRTMTDAQWRAMTDAQWRAMTN
jgi:hypothetical protein